MTIGALVAVRIGSKHNTKGRHMMNAQLDQLAINTIRTLSIDAVQQANSGHPGTPMALAPLVYTIWNRVLRLAVQAHERLLAQGVRCRVVSMPSWDLFEHQSRAYRDSVLPPRVKARVAVEQARCLAGTAMSASRAASMA
jgi:transketolase